MSALRGLLLLGLLLHAPAAHAEAGGRWLLLSDVHFDPTADAKVVPALIAHPASEWHALLEQAGGSPSAYGSDTNYPLLASAVKAMKAQAGTPPVVILAGDLLVHDFRGKFEHAAPRGADFEAFAEKTVAFLAREFDAAFPKAQFVLALGNNDSSCGDYCVEPGSPFLTALAAAWEPLVNREGRAPDFRRHFALGELYTASLPGAKEAQVVVLDSVLWSVHHEGGAKDRERALDDLARVLSASHPAWRWFVAHVPPGIDAFTSARKGKPTPFLEDAAGTRLVALLTSGPAHGAEVITGHTHHASFELLRGSPGVELPLTSVGSVSPIFRNNPGFSLAAVELRTGQIDELTTWVLPLEQKSRAVWVEETRCYSGREDAPSLEAYQARLLHDGTLLDYLSCFAAQSQAGAVKEEDWPWYVCANASQSRESYQQCLDARMPGRR